MDLRFSSFGFWCLLGGLAAFFLVGPARASISVVEPHLAGAIRTDKTVEAFAGATVEVTFHLVDAMAEPLLVRAELYQLADGIAAPIARDLRGVPGPTEGEVVRPWRFAVELPEVRTKTTFLLRLLARANAEEEWRAVGRMRFAVYPADLLEEVRRFAQKTPLQIVGAVPPLELLLAAHGIDWEDSDAPEKAGAGLLFTEADPADFKPILRADQVLVLFVPDEQTTSWAAFASPERGRVVWIPATLLENIAQSPASQLAFLRLFDLARLQLPDSFADQP